MREDVIGRANVSSTPEREDFYSRLSGHSAYALWNVANSIEPWFPTSTSMPTVWQYRRLRPFVMEALDLVSPEKAGRRVVALENPARKGSSACVGWLYTGLQGTRPGEFTSAHNHAAAALRFIVEGAGAYTVVDGEKVTLGAGDFVITPAGTWHDHGVDKGGETAIWQDGLDLLLVNQLEANFYSVYPDIKQPTNRPLNDSSALFGGPNLVPVMEPWAKPYSPLLKYEWAPTYERLCRASEVWEGTPYDGVIMQYTNPLTGGPVMPTLGAFIQRLGHGQHTKAHRQTGSYVYNVAKGRGYSIIDGHRLDWEKNDIFVVPSWAAHEHVNLSADEDTVLFSFTDQPVMTALSLYREEAFAENDGFQILKKKGE